MFPTAKEFIILDLTGYSVPNNSSLSWNLVFFRHLATRDEFIIQDYKVVEISRGLSRPM